MQSATLSVDVEDCFHILDVPGAPTIDQWDYLPSRVEKNFCKLLDLFSGYWSTFDPTSLSHPTSDQFVLTSGQHRDLALLLRVSEAAVAT